MQFFSLLVFSGASIDEAELVTVLKNIGEYKSPAQVASLIKEVDKNSNGKIEYGEFVYIYGQIRLGLGGGAFARIVRIQSDMLEMKFMPAEVAALKKVFKSFDTSGDGR